MANPYQNITSAIANSVPTDTIYVWDGYYNESIIIDKNVQLIGNGSTTTTIDASGLSSNAVNITTEDVEVTGFNITNNETYYGIWANVGGFDIHDNVLNTQSYAIYIDIKRISMGSTVIGDIIVDNNEVIGTEGFFFDIEFRKPITGSNLVFSQTVITNNKLFNTNTGIKIEDYVVFDAYGGSVVWGDVVINNNIINSNGDNGIYFWGWVVNMTNVDVNLGKLDFSNNSITSDTTGMLILPWNTIDVFGSTVITTQDTQLTNNTIVSGYYNGITLYTSYIFYMQDSASVTTGNYYINSNNITTLAPLGQQGIAVYMIGVGEYMYNDSSVDYGNMFIDSNIVNSNEHGIFIDIGESGYEMHDNASANIGDILVTNNNLTSTQNGVHFKMLNVGKDNDGSSIATFGNFIIEDNDIFSNENGTYFDWSYVGTNLSEQASLVMGYFEVGSNRINSTKDGINIDIQYISYDLMDDTQVHLGGLNVIWNEIEAKNGINITRIENLGIDMYDNSVFTWGGLYVEDNIINTTILGQTNTCPNSKSTKWTNGKHRTGNQHT